MKVFFLRVSIAALLLGSGSAVLADPPRGRGDGYGLGRPDHAGRERMEQERASRQGFEDGRGNREEGDRKGARMSPDERRALRQQINEAGQDIYRPRR